MLIIIVKSVIYIYKYILNNKYSLTTDLVLFLGLILILIIYIYNFLNYRIYRIIININELSILLLWDVQINLYLILTIFNDYSQYYIVITIKKKIIFLKNLHCGITYLHII